MRIGATISIVIHLGFVVVALFLGEANLFHSTKAEAITVDIVSSKDAPPELDVSLPTLTEKPTDDSIKSDSKPETAKAETKPAETNPPESKPTESKPVEKKPLQTASRTPQQAAPPPPAVATPTPPSAPQSAVAQPKAVEETPPQAAPIPFTDLTQKYSKLIGEGEGDFDAPSASAANISMDSAKALREHLKTCSVLPKSVSPTDDVRIVMRVSLLPNGKLAKEPLLIQASASEKGPALLKSATDALLACQPYSELPKDKYNEWKQLDLSFTPKDFKGG